jgi:hypothetical protein
MEATIVGWASAPNLRGTIDLLWSCLFTCFVCTWTTLHLNVPKYDSKAKRRWWYKIRMMCVAILGPEYVAGIAFTELRTALLLRQHMENASFKKWTIKHSFFVAMGGYMLSDGQICRPIPADSFIKWHRDGNLVVQEHYEVSSVPSSSQPHPSTVRADKADAAAPNFDSSSNQMDDTIRLPWISEIDIEDRGKADYFIKAIACAQIVWLVVQYIGRVHQSLARSTLESITIAYVVCALCTYFAWWEKPYDLQAPIVVCVAPDNRLLGTLVEEYISFNDDPDVEIDMRTFWIYTIPSAVTHLAYSSLHFLAWNDHFVTSTEKWLFRASCIIFVCFHCVFFGQGFYGAVFRDIKTSTGRGTRLCNAARWKTIHVITNFVVPECMKPFFEHWHLVGNYQDDQAPGFPGYILIELASLTCLFARMFLLIEAFAGLRQSPASMYQAVEWSRYLPKVN